ncbi:MAG: outer membrane beta-barrel protein [Saprospiraceae bacterium]
MNIKFSTLLFILTFSSSAYGQKVVWSRFKFGIQTSPTISWLKTDNPKIGQNGFNTGLKLGATADYYFLENYALSTGIGFGFNQGGKLLHETGGNFLANSTLSENRYNAVTNSQSLPDQVNIRYHIQYVEAPIALKMRTDISGEHLRAFAQAPIITIGVRTQARGDISSGKFETLLKENIKEDVNGLSLSWGLGGGVEYSYNQSTSLTAGIFYQRGFVDVTKDKNNYTIKQIAGQSTPNDTSDDKFDPKVKENSKAVLNAISLRLGIIF